MNFNTESRSYSLTDNEIETITKTIKILKELSDEIDKYFDCVYSSHPLDWADGLEEVLENNGKTVVYDLGFE